MSNSSSGQPVRHASGIDCQEALDLIPALALGGISPAERILLEAHCDHCSSCAAELAALRATANHIALSVPLVAPPARAKGALLARVAQGAEATAAVPEPAPLVLSPAEKRRRPSTQIPASIAERRAPAPVSQRIGVTVSKFAAAPLALALVVVSIYAMQARGDVNSLQNQNAALIGGMVTAQSASANPPGDTGAAAQVAATLTPSSAGSFIVHPVSYTFSAAGGAELTGSTNSISPVESTCHLSGNGDGQYALQITGVTLSTASTTADVYLQTASGKRTFLTSVRIDASGNGAVSFAFNQAIPDNSSLIVGVPETTTPDSRNLQNTITFSLADGNSNPVGLGA